VSDGQRRIRRSDFGNVRRLASGNWQASYWHLGVRHLAPMTYSAKADATAFLRRASAQIQEDRWVSPSAGEVTFSEYSEHWMRQRGDLRPRTRELYQGLLRLHILPPFGKTQLKKISPSAVRQWNSDLSDRYVSTAAKAYRLLRQILGTAVNDELLNRNPCKVRGAGNEKAAERPLLSVNEVVDLTTSMKDEVRLSLILAAWVGLRRGEILGLQRRDLDLDAGTIRVERSAVEVSGSRPALGPPKTDAGVRTVHVPREVLEYVADHLDRFTGPEPESLLFASSVGGPMRSGTLHRAWNKTRTAHRLGAVHFHDVRHFHLTAYAGTGATQAEIMARGGQSSASAALRYQHASKEQDRIHAEALSVIVKRGIKEAQQRQEDLEGEEIAHESRTLHLIHGDAEPELANTCRSDLRWQFGTTSELGPDPRFLEAPQKIG